MAAFNELSEKALTSATAHNVLEFTIFALDDRAPDLLTVISVAPSVSVDATLPPLLTAARHGAQFASSAVVRNAASRCIEGSHRGLVRALLQLPGLADGLGGEYPTWLLRVIRNYGSAAWPDIARHLGQFPEFAGAARLLAAADMTRPDDAVSWPATATCSAVRVPIGTQGCSGSCTVTSTGVSGPRSRALSRAPW